ncbi:beta-N-acetylhexosaminidase [Marinicella litoralis]|uniref:beta-N-acetylhexosaminidase n=1 Tax=Marinicella litoralis TaxID=644220 RepID=A0A4R6XN66_9GAMM|nr:beta-N-acetylhexosaminidase [Marinicella litoralis]TDR19384.1 beta-N-acetylhexosaminidase [Marinicella litoralis]
MTYIMTGIEGFELTEQDLTNLDHPLTCGVIFFKRNFKNYDQLVRLVNHIRALKGKDFILAVDQEGGRVIRFGLPFTQLPPLGLIGRQFVNNTDAAKTLCHLHAWLMATELLSVGIDLSFAPVLDIDNGSDVIGDRAFTNNPLLVSELAALYCNSMHAAGMKTTAKHYPGHGTVKADSHFELPIDSRSQAELFDHDMLPFSQLIPTGCIDAMMLSHVIYSKVCDLPAGYSKKWHQEILRQQQKFQGVSISDDLGMKAAECVGDILQRYQACVDAGIDLTLLCEPKLCSDLYSNNRLKYLPNNPAKLIKIKRLKGQSTLDTQQPFWQQMRWQQARKALVSLMADIIGQIK